MPTDEQRALWAAIRANPDDDTARLVYADWLQENGDEPRAEFIRVQCQMESLRGDQRARRKVIPGLEHRARVLHTANSPRWAEPLFRALGRHAAGDKLESWGRATSFRRGFIIDLRTDLDGAHRIMTAGADLEPLQEATVTHTWGKYNRKKLTDLFAWDGVGCVNFFSFNGATDECVSAVTSGAAPRLTHLQFDSGEVTDAGADLLARWPYSASLLYLNLRWNRITDRGALALATSPYLNPRSTLSVDLNPIGPDGRRALVSRFGGNVHL